MGTVFKKQTTRPLPAEAEIIVRQGQRLARWKGANGKTRTAPLTVGNDGSDRVVTESPYYLAKWRDGSGIVREQSTGCLCPQEAAASFSRIAGSWTTTNRRARARDGTGKRAASPESRAR